MRKVLAGALALGIVSASVFLGVGSASAADPLPPGPVFPNVPPVSQPNAYNPSKSTGRRFMINILGGVLGKAQPNSWRAEQLANRYVFDPIGEWDSLQRRLGVDPADTRYLTQPSTVEDYTLARRELEVGQEKAGRNLRAPSTRMQVLGKAASVVGGKVIPLAGAGLVGFELGVAGGKGISSLLGFNVEGGLCTGDAGGFVGAITATDCKSFFAISDSYAKNQDVVPGVVGDRVCGVGSESGKCATLLGVRRYLQGNVDPYVVSAFKFEGGLTGVWIEYAPPLAPSQVILNQSPVNDGKNYEGGYPCYLAAGNLVVKCNRAREFRANELQPVRYWVSTSVASPRAVVKSVDTDPQRILRCVVTGTDGVVRSTDSAPYRDGAGQLPPPVCPSLPEGVTAANVGVDTVGPKGPERVFEQPTTAEFQDWFTKYPECRTGACKLDLVRKATTGTIPASCFDLGDACAAWFDDPQKDAVYQCRYGLKDVGLGECAVYSGVFKPERVTAGAPYSDPVTGVWSGGQSSPSAASDAFGRPLQNPDGRRECYDKGWSAANPVEWVMVPVGCSLERAFVPRTAVVGVGAAKVVGQWQATAPGAAVQAVTAWKFNVAVGGCNGLAVRLPFLDVVGMGTFRIGSACPGSLLATAADVSRIALNIVVSLGGAMAITRYLGGIVNYGGVG